VKSLDSKLLEKFLRKASQDLKGEWLLTGGTLLPAVGIDLRATVDIDFIGLGQKEKNQSLELMNLASELGLSIESINQAASFFLSKIKYSNDDLIVLKKTKACTIFRPSFLLYFKLKVPRLSETDVQDCEAYFKYCISVSDFIDKKAILNFMKESLKKAQNETKVERLQKLKSLFI
jgi:hypothetical protein